MSVMEKEHVDIIEVSEKLGRLFYLLTQKSPQVRVIISGFPSELSKEYAELLTERLLYEFVKAMGLGTEYIPPFEFGKEYIEGWLILDVGFPIERDKYVELLCKELGWYYVLEGLLSSTAA
ncbi:MAG: hypothetical protein QXU09_04130 [Thermoproteota archaeon]